MELFSKAEWLRTSWVEAANNPTCGFPLQSLPWCIFSGQDSRPRPGIGIGASILDLHWCSGAGLFEGLPADLQKACQARTLNGLIACGAPAHAALRSRLMDLLDSSADQATRDTLSAALSRMGDATLLKPVDPANYTDFYASIDHATRVVDHS
jgi:fumarylacetoacetase